MEVVLKRMSPPADDGFHFFSKDWSNKTAHALVMISEKLMFQQEDETKNVVLCPAGADASLLFKHVDLDQLIEGKQFWLMTKVSIEPLLMQAFSAEGTWPVPLYYGACGDLIVEEYRGNSLRQSFSLPWKARVFLSVQILRAADMFTFSHPELAFYFTDLSTDNLVVDSSGILTLVDLDNVIVVSKNMAKYLQPNDWNKIHISNDFSQTSFSFSTADICSHHLSDHNYYAVCQHILLKSELNQGLLHDVPEDQPQVVQLLNECSSPTGSESRIEPGRKLEKTLASIISDFAWEEEYSKL